VCADTSRATATSTTALHEGPRPTAATAASTTTTPAADRLHAAAQGPSAGGVRGGRRPRRRNVPPSTTRAVAAAHDDGDAAEFPVTFRSADLFVVTKTKLYSTFTISLKVGRVLEALRSSATA